MKGLMPSKEGKTKVGLGTVGWVWLVIRTDRKIY